MTGQIDVSTYESLKASWVDFERFYAIYEGLDDFLNGFFFVSFDIFDCFESFLTLSGLYKAILGYFGAKKIRSFWGNFGPFFLVDPGSPWDHFGIISEPLWCRFDPILRPFWAFFGHFYGHFAIV